MQEKSADCRAVLQDLVMLPVTCALQLAFVKATGLVRMWAKSTNTMVRVYCAVHRRGVVLQHAVRALTARADAPRCECRS